MLQKARSSSSRSFMREAEFAKLILGNPYEEDYFRDLISEVVEKRKSPEITYTGAKNLREQLLSCLMQKGNVQTANIWARLAPSSLTEIEYLLEILEERLREENDVFGAIELHLADREILSPHIQYVGTNASKAEIIIAKTLVELKYEVSIESAIGKKYEDYEKPYEFSRDIPIVNTNTFFEEQIKRREEHKEIEDILNEIDEIQNRFLNIFHDEAKFYNDEADRIFKETIEKIEKKENKTLEKQEPKELIDNFSKFLEDSQKELDEEIEKMIQETRFR